MHNVLLKFTGIDAKPQINKGDLRLFIRYTENNSPKSIEKILVADDSIEDFVVKLLKEIRMMVKKSNQPFSDNMLNSFVNVVIDEKEIGETEERIIAGLKKLRDKVRGFRSVRSADNYMNKFFDVSRLEIKL